MKRVIFLLLLLLRLNPAFGQYLYADNDSDFDAKHKDEGRFLDSFWNSRASIKDISVNYLRNANFRYETIEYPKYYEKDTLFMMVIGLTNRIRNLSHDDFTTTFYAINSYYLEAPIGKAAYVYFNFLDKMTANVDSSTLFKFISIIGIDYDRKFAERISQIKSKSEDARECAEALEAQGDYYYSRLYLNKAIESYMGSQMLLNRQDYNQFGILERKIGSCYMLLGDDFYLRKAIQHYENSAEGFNAAKNKTDEIVSKMLIAELLMSIRDPDYDKIHDQLAASIPQSYNDTSDYDINKQFINRIGSDKHKNCTYIRKIIEGVEPYENDTTTYFYYSLLGTYYGIRGEYSLAKAFNMQALATLLNKMPESIERITFTLGRLSWLSSMKEDEYATRAYSDFKFDIYRKQGRRQMMVKTMIILADNLGDAGASKSGEEITNKVLAVLDGYHFPPLVADDIKSSAYMALYRLYSKNNQKDSAINYLNKYMFNKITFSQLGEKMLTKEADITSKINEEAIRQEIVELGELAENLKLKDGQIKKGDSLLTQIRLALADSQKNLENLHKDILLAQNTLTFTESNLRKEKRKLNSTYEYGLFLLICICISGGTAYWIIVKRKNNRIANTRAELNTLTKGKLHNTKSKYNGFLILMKKDPRKAINYAEKSVDYLEVALNDVNWESLKWTIGQEWDLLLLYYEAEKIRWPNIVIKQEFDETLIRNARFLTEVFTTLLDNSIIHGFQYKKRDEECFFIIKILKKSNWIYFEVIDNGITDEGVTYLSERKQNRGLGLLKRRIETEIKMQNENPKYIDFFSANRNIFGGTTIKFIIPYAISC